MNEEPTACLDSRFLCAHGKTRLTSCFARAPLKIAKTFPEDSGIGVCMMDASPGLLAGDYYELSWHLEDSAHVFVTTQGFTRVHPSHERPCRLRQKINLGPNASMEYFPEPLMLYKEASLRSECEINMAPGSTLLFAEVICAGRVGKGEEFEFSSLQNRLRVHYDNKLNYISQTGLRPSSLAPKCIGAWQKYTHWGNFYVFSERVDKTLCEALRADFVNAVDAGSAEVWGGVSLLETNGLSAAFMGNRACDLQSVVQKLRMTAKNHLET